LGVLALLLKLENMETLQFDLNELVSKEIGLKIESLEKRLEQSQKTIQDKNTQIYELDKKVKKSETILGIVEFLRTKYSEIKEGEDKGGWYDSRAKLKFIFIEKIMLNLYGIPKEGNGWLSSRSDGSLGGYLAVNYYKNKAQVVDLLKVFGENDKIIGFIELFKMPYDYPKCDVIEYVKDPKYNTNGCIFCISQYWVEYGCGKSNMPHNLIMKNPFILEDDVFSELINSINKKVSNFYYLFGLPEYNSLSEKQMQLMGETLIDMPISRLKEDTIQKFIKNNLCKFNNKTLDYLYGLATSENQFSLLHWENFPAEYQMRYLNSLPFDKVWATINNYSCKWTIDDKENFLKQYLNK